MKASHSPSFYLIHIHLTVECVMGSTTPFEEHNDFLFLSYNINTPFSFLLNTLAIYLIVFKSSFELMFRLTHLIFEIFTNSIWVAAMDIFMNCLFQPLLFFPLFAGTGHGILITNFGFSTFTCFVSFTITIVIRMYYILAYFYFYFVGSVIFYSGSVFLSSSQFYLCISLYFMIISVAQNVILKLCYVDSSHWSEILEKISIIFICSITELLRISNICIIPYSFTMMVLMLNTVLAVIFTSKDIYAILLISFRF
uniref:7TM_GPCR_Srx domain-containing protein n=1 Tax=Heterorhabditis bacteriophora TaxID=37862 RepID=A0A1I7WHG4_HETBA